MKVTDWAMAKEVWKAIKDSGLDVHEGLVVHLGVGPDRTISVSVALEEDRDYAEEIEDLESLVSELEDRVRELTVVKTESHIESFQKVFQGDQG